MTAILRIGTSLAALILLCGGAPAEDYKSTETLLETGETVMGETIVYPPGEARVTSLVVTLAPGEETGRHNHPVPTYGYMLEGEITVAYEGRGSRSYRQGEAFMEAEDVWHNGRNSGFGPARVLVVFMGAKGAANVAHPQ